MEISLNKGHRDSSKARARPLTLKEVLLLRDGIALPKTFPYPYKIQKLSREERVILSLN